jgi:hypothetical protein
MLDKKLYYKKIFDLVPCLQHGKDMADYLKYIQVELEKEGNKKGDIEHLNFVENTLRTYLSISDDPYLTYHQCQVFSEVQRNVLEFLFEPQ